MVVFSNTVFSILKQSSIMPRILKLNDSSSGLHDLALGVSTLLKAGKIIAVPTDTIYGIACLAQNTLAIQNVVQTKVRDSRKPLAICVSDITDIEKWGKITFPESLLSHLLPGPVTVVLERQKILNPKLNPGVSTIAIRIPDHTFMRHLCRLSGGPLALTSANLGGYRSSLAIEEFKELWPYLDLIVDGGVLGAIDPNRLGSTIVSLAVEGHYKIVRDGCALEKTLDVLNQYSLKPLQE